MKSTIAFSLSVSLIASGYAFADENCHQINSMLFCKNPSTVTPMSKKDIDIRNSNNIRDEAEASRPIASGITKENCAAALAIARSKGNITIISQIKMTCASEMEGKIEH